MKKTKSLLSIFVILSIVACSIFTYTINVSADNTITYDWQKMGVNRANKEAKEEDYYADGVVNLRCSYSSWDSKKQYLWWRKMTNKKIELLAPAGDLERLKINLLYGADAVYFGGKKYSLRANASNFGIEEIIERIEKSPTAFAVGLILL